MYGHMSCTQKKIEERTVRDSSVAAILVIIYPT
jgi:hypothetical protein